jgi:radical SAM superfamily enzyme YgiQ (UPF0313 family)
MVHLISTMTRQLQRNQMNDKEKKGSRDDLHKDIVVLVYPCTGIDVKGISIFLPMPVMFVANALDNAGFETTIIDQRVDSNWRATLIKEVKRRPLYVGISAMTGAQISWGRKAANVIRGASPDVPIVWGGTHASILPNETLEDDLVDAVVTGPGEEPAVDLAHSLAKGDRHLVGTVLSPKKKKSGIDKTKEAVSIWNSLDLEKYVTPIVRNVRGLSHVTSRGCPHNCAYCYNRSVNDSSWSASPATTVVEELEQLAQYGHQGVLLFDDNFFVNRKRVETVAQMLIDKNLGLKIKADCRADYLVKYDDDFFELIKRAGFELLYIGAESGSDRVLEMINKEVTVEQLLRANQLLKKFKIRPHYSFMAGLPGETIDDMRQTVRLMLRLKEENETAYLSPIKGFVPYPGTRLFDTAVEAGFNCPTTLAAWSRFDWSSCDKPWLTKKQSRFVEKLTYVTSGIDTSLVELSGLDQNRFLHWNYRQFSKLCHKRCRKDHLGIIPELPIVRLVKRLMASCR